MPLKEIQNGLTAVVAALTGQVIASIPEMCTAVDENGTPGYYSYLNPNFTIFHEDDKTLV